MKSVFFIFSFFFLGVQAFAFEGKITMKMKNLQNDANMKFDWYFDNKNHCRLDMYSQIEGKNVTTVFLVDQSANKFRTYLPSDADKHFYEIAIDQIKSDVTGVEVERTTETKVISGYKCEKWVVKSETGSAECWIAKDIEIDNGSFAPFFKTSLEMQAMAKLGVKGFALEVTNRDARGLINSVFTVETIQTEKVTENQFAIPQGFSLYSTNNK